MNRWGFVALVLFLVDQVSKFLAVHNGFFSLHKNYGIAFDLPVPSWIVIPLTLGIIIAATFALWHHRLNLKLSAALIFIILGGLSNLIDRLVYGFTVDYIILFGRSAINLSDLMIVGGVLLVIYHSRRPVV
ncbi:MAG: signal peptidase II [Patescibacteria group bacterium]